MTIFKTLKKLTPVHIILLSALFGGSLAPLALYIKFVKDPFESKLK